MKKWGWYILPTSMVNVNYTIVYNIYLWKPFTSKNLQMGGGKGDGMVNDALMVNILMVDLPTISNECLGLKFHGDGWIFAKK